MDVQETSAGGPRIILKPSSTSRWRKGTPAPRTWRASWRSARRQSWRCSRNLTVWALSSTGATKEWCSRLRGREVAEAVKFRHDTLKEFLMAINVPEKIANSDACYMEHELHPPSTIQQIRLLLEALQSNPGISERIRRNTPRQEEQSA